MLYVATMTWQPGLSREQRDGALMRRAQWQYPQEMKVVGEYWPLSERHAVISVFETDDYGAILELELTWGDVFQIEVNPATTAEDGLKVGPEAMARRAV